MDSSQPLKNVKIIVKIFDVIFSKIMDLFLVAYTNNITDLIFNSKMFDKLLVQLECLFFKIDLNITKLSRSHHSISKPHFDILNQSSLNVKNSLYFLNCVHDFEGNNFHCFKNAINIFKNSLQIINETVICYLDSFDFEFSPADEHLYKNLLSICKDMEREIKRINSKNCLKNEKIISDNMQGVPAQKSDHLLDKSTYDPDFAENLPNEDQSHENPQQIVCKRETFQKNFQSAQTCSLNQIYTKEENQIFNSSSLANSQQSILDESMHLINDQEQYFCIVCEIFICSLKSRNVASELAIHFKGKSHKKKLENNGLQKFIDYNISKYIEINKDNSLYCVCTLCNTKLPQIGAEDVLSHLKSKKHAILVINIYKNGKEKQNKKLSKEPLTSALPPKVLSTISKSVTKSVLAAEKKHPQESRTNGNVCSGSKVTSFDQYSQAADAKIPNSSYPVSYNNLELQANMKYIASNIIKGSSLCIVCNKLVPNSDKNILGHCTGKRHMYLVSSGALLSKAEVEKRVQSHLNTKVNQANTRKKIKIKKKNKTISSSAGPI